MIVPGIKTIYRSDFQPAISEERVITVICEYLGFTFDVIKKKNRVKKMVYARYLLCHFLKKYTSHTCTSIGNLLHRDHTTVLYGLHTIQDWIDTEDSVRNEVGLIQIKIIES
jgi:chromosomal replication initiation ATPase DnaA